MGNCRLGDEHVRSGYCDLCEREVTDCWGSKRRFTTFIVSHVPYAERYVCLDCLGARKVIKSALLDVTNLSPDVINLITGYFVS